jgi:two-component system, cell cycle response regulator DivK
MSVNDEITILYVEDNPDNRLLVRRILMAEGFRVLEAPDATSAMDILHKEIPNLILMDINMPDLDGYTLTAQLREKGILNGTPIVALTANVMRGDRERSLAAGCDGYIQKPIDVDQLPRQVEKYLKRK